MLLSPYYYFLSFTPALSLSAMFLCTVSAANLPLQMTLGLYISNNTKLLTAPAFSFWYCTQRTTNTGQPAFIYLSLTHYIMWCCQFNQEIAKTVFPWGLIECVIFKAYMETEGEIPCLNVGIIRREGAEKDEIKKRIWAVGKTDGREPQEPFWQLCKILLSTLQRWGWSKGGKSCREQKQMHASAALSAC